MKRCKEQNLDLRDITNCLKEEMSKILEIAKWRLQNSIEIDGLFSLQLLAWRIGNRG